MKNNIKGGSILFPNTVPVGNIEVNNRVTAAFQATIKALKAANRLQDFKVDAGPNNIGVDVGTGSARAGVFDATGRLLANARKPIAIWREAGEIVEHSSEDIWRAATGAVREAVQNAGLADDAVAGIGFDATCSLVVLDPSGASLPVGPSGEAERDVIVWMDHRAVGEADLINSGGHEVLRYVGGKLSKTEGGVTLVTPGGTLGVRGGVVIIDVQKTGRVDAVLVYGKSMTMTGRKGPLDDLTGDGVATLRSRP